MTHNNLFGFGLSIIMFVTAIFLFVFVLIFVGNYYETYQLIENQQVAIEYLSAYCQ